MTDVAVLSGGVGAARFLGGVVQVVDPQQVAAVVNTADDTVLHGLSISPDLDTITYTLAGAIDPERGWGLAGETWAAMGALERYAAVRPPSSAAAPTWFNLGDRDLATHLYRTARLAEGGRPTEVADEIRHGLGCRRPPAADDGRASRHHDRLGRRRADPLPGVLRALAPLRFRRGRPRRAAPERIRRAKSSAP